MRMVDIITKKKSGYELSPEEISFFIKDTQRVRYLITRFPHL